MNMLDILKNDYNNFYDKAEALIWTVDGCKYTTEEFEKGNFRIGEVEDNFYVEIASNMAVGFSKGSSFAYSFKIGVRKFEYQGIERWVHDGYFFILDDEWEAFFEGSADEKIEEAIHHMLKEYKPSEESSYYLSFDDENLWYLDEFQMAKNCVTPLESIEDALMTLSASFREAMKVICNVYDSRKFAMDYYEKIKKQK